MNDLTYTQDGMFTRFIPETAAGESVWNTMAEQMGGVAAVLNFEANKVIQQIRSAGYKVEKAKKFTGNIDDILKELGI